MQRNNIFHAIAGGKLDPAACEMKSFGSEVSIIHAATGSRLDIARGVIGFTCTAKIGNEPKFTYGRPLTWDALYAVVKNWATRVIDWSETPDLWEGRYSWNQFTGVKGDPPSNTPFASEERQVISSQLASIKEAVKKTYELTAAQEEKIDEQFKEAEEASERLGRKDWVLLFMGTMFSLVLADVITPDIFHHILTMAFHGLEHLFVGGGPSVRGVLSE
jgi:hypothetical protein